MPIYKDIAYTLIRSHRRKTASIYIERDGSVTVRVPDNLAEAEIAALIEGKRYWIHKHLTEWRELNAAQVAREYVNGEGFLYPRSQPGLLERTGQGAARLPRTSAVAA